MRRLLIAAACFALPLGAAPALAEDAKVAPAADAAPIDPARLATARRTVDYVFPDGTYARLMNGTMNGIMDRMMESVGKMPLRDLAALGGVSEDKLARLGDATLTEVMAIYDPHYQERAQITMRAVTAEMVKLMTRFEPAIRDGLAKAYARRFTVTQLEELNRFFATPTGTTYAADSMAIFMDPEVIAKMTELMPAMIQEMPALTAKTKDAAASLPPPREFKDLSAAERRRLAALLGVSEEELARDKSAGLGGVK